MDLRTTYMGLELRNPLIASASPLSESIDNIRRIEDAGAGAIVLFSLFEEQIRAESEALEHFLTYGTNPPARSAPDGNDRFRIPPEAYLNLISRATSMTDIPVIGSLNGYSDDAWTEYARMIEQAGANGLELNIHYTPTDLHMSGAEVEAKYLYVLESVKVAVRIPVAIKLSPYFSSIGHMAQLLSQAGADALVLFNRFHQADINLARLEFESHIQLSTPYEIRLPLMWMSILFGQVNASLAATGGVQSAQEVLKYILVGADAVMTTSALIHQGIDHLQTILQDMTAWMKRNEFASIAHFKGTMSHHARGAPESAMRDEYIRALKGFDLSDIYANHEP